ncbi:endonuclease [Bizionia argentinensis JUB59]|uniref:Endonuclease n=1 Tax=Bizionia argentinensis JUB59 TaxID=1046627 RepID=G2EAZ9_9FLAO|nr:endonuclease/exonuclease/phosphatase family protein [Bizionia argentinensis]EGV44381.2 endonuclease [Bizionia argentinensis JUB59]
MKKLNLIDKFIYLLNGLLAFLLLLSYLLPFAPPKTFALLSVLSLGVPFLMLLNVIFCLYWVLKLKKQLILSLVVLIVGYFSFGSLYKFSSIEEIEHDNELKVMNYNVRLFNVYDWISDNEIQDKMLSLIKRKAPDVLSIQEYHPHPKVDLSFFKYKFEKLSGNKVQYGQVILSQYPIINSGSIEFPDTDNNAIFADIVKANDTIRIYNIHLQSLKIDTNIDNLNQEDSERLLKQTKKTFVKQQFQTELFLKHKKASPYKMIITGDFNNTAFSYVYKELKGDLNDAFIQAGNGFGRTYDFKFFPIRIDFILSDPSFEITNFKTIDDKHSDHYPIMATLKLH